MKMLTLIRQIQVASYLRVRALFFLDIVQQAHMLARCQNHLRTSLFRWFVVRLLCYDEHHSIYAQDPIPKYSSFYRHFKADKSVGRQTSEIWSIFDGSGSVPTCGPAILCQKKTSARTLIYKQLVFGIGLFGAQKRLHFSVIQRSIFIPLFQHLFPE